MSDEQKNKPPRQEIGPGGDPILARSTTPQVPATTGVWLDCGWGRIVFGQSFSDAGDAADVLRSEAAGTRDICVYLPAAHVFVTRHAAEFFVDPSLMYRLSIPAAQVDDTVPAGVTIRRLETYQDAEAVNALYARNHMVTAPIAKLVDVAARDEVMHLVAVLPNGEIIGTLTGVDHVRLFDDPSNGSSLWCFTVDPVLAPPGLGTALFGALATELAERGRSFVDLSVLADNTGAIRFYEKLGFQRTPDLVVKRKSMINERLFRSAVPAHYDELNPYAKIVADEAMRRGIRVEVTDPSWGELKLTHGAITVHTRESLSELTSALAMSRCDDKRVTRRILSAAGLHVPAGVELTSTEPFETAAHFLANTAEVVVKPARGEQGQGITVGVTDNEALRAAVDFARKHCPDVLVEERVGGEDLRVIVIDHTVVAAAVRRPAQVRGDGKHTIAELIERQSSRRSAATGGESRIPMDAGTTDTVSAAGHQMDDVLGKGEILTVRRTANLHTGGTISDVTADLHPALAAACVTASKALTIPVTGIDLLVDSPSDPGYVIIEANERPGLANHEPQPTAERFIDLLFPTTTAPPRTWTPHGVDREITES